MRYSRKTFMLREMKEFSKISRQDLIKWMKFYAQTLIKHIKNPEALLQRLSLYDRDMPLRERESLIQILFLMDFKTAKDVYADGFLGHLQIVINY